MSSHREAPEISKDPVADNTDTYAFVSPDRPGTVTLIANFNPAQNPAAGPNFYEFGDDVLYEIHVSNAGDGRADVTYQFRFTTIIDNPNTFLYNTGPITSIVDRHFNRRQYYSVTRVTRNGHSQVLASNLTVPPVNVGPRSTPDYANVFTPQATHEITGGRIVFAGQRADPFYVDLGSIFDLGTLRPLESHHLIPSAAAAGVNSLQGLNVSTIGIQVAVRELTMHSVTPTNPLDPNATIGVWASASRFKSRVLSTTGTVSKYGPYQQVSRLGNPLFNEVIVPMGYKDRWNYLQPYDDGQFAKYVNNPELAGLLPVLYPGAFPNLAAYKKPRADLNAILLTGIPKGIVPGFQNFTGPTMSDMLRLNVAVPATASPNPLGLVAGDAAGFPNGRRLEDDIVTIELRAVAGLTIPLVDKSFTPDAVVSSVGDGTTNTNGPLLTKFPYVGTPHGGYESVPATPTD
jgi:hypothetical protein